jgi:hypothetical protein
VICAVEAHPQTPHLSHHPHLPAIMSEGGSGPGAISTAEVADGNHRDSEARLGSNPERPPGRNPSQPQKSLRVAVCDPFPVGGADWQLVQERTRLDHGRIGIVGRKQNPIDTDLKQ